MDWRTAVVGLVVGTSVGLTGIGSGTLTLPLLMFWVGIPPLQAVGSNLIYSAVTKAVAAADHLQRGNVEVRLVALLALGSVPAGVLAARGMIHLADQGSGWVEVWIGAALLAAGAILARQALQRGDGEGGPPVPRRPSHGATLSLAGAGSVKGPPALQAPLLALGGGGIGIAVGATSVGSGSCGTTLLAAVTRLEARRIVGTVTGHALVLTAAAGITHAGAGAVSGPVVAGLLVGSLPGVVLGTRLATRVPDAWLRGLLAALLLVLGVRTVLASLPGVGA